MKLRLALGLILAAALTRLLPHPMNFTAIGAMSIFSAAYFSNNKLQLLAPAAALFLSDLIYNNIIYPQYFDGFTLFTSWILYFAMAAMMLAGWLILKNGVTISRVVAASLTVSVIFYLVSNFWSWYAFPTFPHTPAGLAMCYAAGIFPFFVNTILGDLFYSALLFGTFEWVNRRQFQFGIRD